MKKIAYLFLSLMCSILFATVGAVCIDLFLVSYTQNLSGGHFFFYLVGVISIYCVFIVLMPPFHREMSVMGTVQKRFSGTVEVSHRKVFISDEVTRHDILDIFRDLHGRTITVRIWVKS